MSSSSQPRKTVSSRQFEILVEFLGKNRDLARGRLKTRDARAVSQKLWSEVANLLNAEGGINKSGKDWLKWYTDHKSRVLARHRKIKSNITGTGGGPGAHVTPLSELELRLCSILGAEDEICLGGETLGTIRFVPQTLQIPQEIRDIGNNDDEIINEIIQDQSYCLESLDVDSDVDPEPIKSLNEKIPKKRQRPTNENQNSDTMTPLEKSQQTLASIEYARIAAEEKTANALTLIAESLSLMAQSQNRTAQAIEKLCYRIKVKNSRIAIESNDDSSSNESN